MRTHKKEHSATNHDPGILHCLLTIISMNVCSRLKIPHSSFDWVHLLAFGVNTRFIKCIPLHACAWHTRKCDDT